VRDIRDRLTLFGITNFTVEKIALTMGQVEEYHPPPNPAKMSDPRAEEYVSKHGDSSWEVDALPPDALSKLIRKAIEQRLDIEKMNKVKEQEEKDKQALTDAVEYL
jgi:hypothetical protein